MKPRPALPLWESFGFFLLVAAIVGIVIYVSPPPGTPDHLPPPVPVPLPVPPNYNHPSYSDPQD